MAAINDSDLLRVLGRLTAAEEQVRLLAEIVVALGVTPSSIKERLDLFGITNPTSGPLAGGYAQSMADFRKAIDTAPRSGPGGEPGGV